MTIKEVEKKTGLTAKSIRYYEEKKLIDIDRNQDNSYRTFTEEDIIRLKWIKIYRQLDFSIQEISELLKKDSDKSKKIIQNKIDEHEEKKNSCEYKKELCTKLCEDNNLENADVEGYEAIINIYESAEWNEFVEEMKIQSVMTKPVLICTTLSLLGPILWLFYEIITKDYSRILQTSIVSLTATVLLTLLWRNYISSIKKNKKYHEISEKRNRGFLPVILLALIIFLVIIMVLFFFVYNILLPSHCLFFYMNYITSYSFIGLNLLIAFTLAFIILKKFHYNSDLIDTISYGISKIGIILFAIWLIGIYICLTNLTYVTNDYVVCINPLDLKGEKYKITDVTKVRAEFNKDGEFCYTLYVDEKEILINVGLYTPNYDIERYNNDNYLAIEELDKKLMELGAEKISNDKNAKKSTLGDEYKKRCLDIIKNESK